MNQGFDKKVLSVKLIIYLLCYVLNLYLRVTMARITARLCRFACTEIRASKVYMAKTNKLQSYKTLDNVIHLVPLFDNLLTWLINFVLRLLLPCDRSVFLVNQEMAVTNCLLKFDEVENFAERGKMKMPTCLKTRICYAASRTFFRSLKINRNISCLLSIR